ncbi:hypothetical protein VTG60DRAFT_2084 [Thermothelomyces hinnuleus]
MKTGYPRFFIPRVVERLATRLLEQQKPELGDGTGDQKLAILLNSIQHAHLCRKAVGEEDIFLVTFPAELYLAAKAIWQHTGFGISSRRAAYWLETAPFLVPTTAPKALISPTERARQLGEGLDALKTRIAAGQSSPPDNLHVNLSDVFLFLTGMTAITETAAAIKSLRRKDSSSPPRVAVFGFLYVDTNKVLSRVLGFEAVQYHSTPASLSALEADLEGSPTMTDQTATPNQLDFLVTEFPGNPLLQAPDLERLGRMARTHGFALVVDDTVGTHVNLALLAHCDVICTSLTKMFSGACDVMGGSAVLNPASPYRDRLARALGCGRPEAEERAWFWEDVVHMERNSRDFGERVRRASENARRVAEMLRRSGSVSEVYYPLGSPTQDWYDRYRREGAGYGYLLSIKFKTPAQAVAFYDALDVAKGPSLGTNFTLCCAYTLLAHYKELEWAAEYGVVEDLVRISVGLEESEWLEERVGRALMVAERLEERRGCHLVPVEGSYSQPRSHFFRCRLTSHGSRLLPDRQCLAAFSPASPAGNFSGLDQPWVHDLELMHHYCTVTSSTLAHHEGARHVWRMVFPQEGYRKAYLTRSAHHYTIGQETFTALLRDVTSTNWRPVFCFATIVIAQVLCLRAQSGDGGLAATTPTSKTLELFSVTKGVKAVLLPFIPQLNQTNLAPLVNSVWLVSLDPPPESKPTLKYPPLPDDVFRALSRLGRFFEEDELLDNKVDYGHAVTVLDVSATQIAYADVNTEVGAVLLWPFLIPDSIVAGIEQREPHALLILAYYAVFLNALNTTFWFLRGWGRQLLSDIELNLKHCHRHVASPLDRFPTPKKGITRRHQDVRKHSRPRNPNGKWGSTTSIAHGRHHHHSPDGNGAEENQYDIEMMHLSTPQYDQDRLGTFFRASQRQADVLIVARHADQQRWRPRCARATVSSAAATASSPVDIYVPGCPPTAEALMYGMLQLKRKIRNTRTTRMR